MSDPGRRGGEGPTGSRPFQPLPADARRDLDPLASVSSEDRQYQEDLKKALMLSLETLAAENEQRRRSAAARSPEKKSLQHQPDLSSSMMKSGVDLRQSSEAAASSSAPLRPRPRPEARTASTRSPRLSAAKKILIGRELSLPPPPPRSSVHNGKTERTRGQQDDLISWPSGSAQQESDNNTDFDAMKTQLKELYLQKPIPSSISSSGDTPVLVPLPRTVFPTIDKNNQLFYPTFPPQPHSLQPSFFHQSTSMTRQQEAVDAIDYTPLATAMTPTPPFQPYPPPSSQPSIFVSSKTNFKQTLGLPCNNSNTGPTSLQQPDQVIGSAKHTALLVAPHVSQGMVKSQSWTGGQLEPLPPSETAKNDPWRRIPSATNMKGSQSDFTLGVHLKDSSGGKASNGDSLIDLGGPRRPDEETKLARVSVLEAFDPLLMGEDAGAAVATPAATPKAGALTARDWNYNEQGSLSDSSFYDSYDPFEYMSEQAAECQDPSDEEQQQQQASTRQLVRKHTRQPSVTEAVDERTVEKRLKQQLSKIKPTEQSKDLLGLLTKEKDVAVDREVREFTRMAEAIRSEFVYEDEASNPGGVVSAKIKGSYPKGTSIKCVVAAPGNRSGVLNFTCDVSSTVEHVILEVICNLECEVKKPPESFALQVSGTSEYLEPLQSQLHDYEYVHSCYKYDRDPHFVLLPKAKMAKPYLRTREDDKRDGVVLVEDISPKDHMKTLTYEELKIVLDTLLKESNRISEAVNRMVSCSETHVMRLLRPKQLIQAVKAVCAFLGNIETLEVQEVCDQFVKSCLDFDKAKGEDGTKGKLRPEIMEEVVERYPDVLQSTLSKRQGEHAKQIKTCLERIKETVWKVIEIYAKTFRVNFSIATTENENAGEPKESINVYDTLLLRLCALHRLQADWTFDDYSLTMQVYHGTRPIAEAVATEFVRKSESLYERVKFDTWVELKNVRICSLPREARLVFTLIGRGMVSNKDQSARQIKRELGWSSIQLFNYERCLAQGTFFLSLWPREVEKQIGPSPDPGSHPNANTCPVVSVEMPELGSPVVFPDKIPIQMPPRREYNFKDLDFMTQQQLLDICAQDILTFTELPAAEREVLWEKRYYLREIPGALPKVLLAAHSWEYSCLPGLYGLLHSWKRPTSMDILPLFMPCFPDAQVRECAIEWLSSTPSDELVSYLPQLLEALKHETWSVSPLTRLLLRRSLASPRVAHALYWLLTQSLPGQTPQNTFPESSTEEGEEARAQRLARVKVARYRRRLQMLMRALYTVGGQAMRNSFCKQQEMLKVLNEMAAEVKSCSDQSRTLVLSQRLTALSQHLQLNPTALPLSPAFLSAGVHVQQCNYFPSKTVPLKIVFSSGSEVNETNNEGSTEFGQPLPSPMTYIPVIFKVGDDLRQDMLTTQMIRVMDRIWLQDDLDLKMVTFGIVPTGDKQGMLEMVTEAKTLREIQVTGSRGVTGSFKETPISDWLEKHNPSQLQFTRAVQNFTRSCAGYSIATYILGICDRHNDNIMIKQSGHLFHIDFSKFLGDAERFGNFRRDRSPFVLSHDMVYVINGGGKPSQKFHDFVDLCCTGFNVIRKNGNLLLNLFALMSSSGIPHVTNDAVRYVQRALLPDLSPTEAAATFSRMIEESVSSWFVHWNFFIHNLGQMRWGGENDGGGGELLSFIPKRYSMSTDGRITTVTVFDIQKRYSPEKHYVFILKVFRAGMKDPNFLFRTYKEFCELDFKLSTEFRGARNSSLRKSGFNLGRQEIFEVAQRRKHDIALFLDSLFDCSDQVAHSDLVYTFFHPLLRDQEEASVHIRKLKEQKVSGASKRSSAGKIKGELKLSLEYRKDTLYVMVCHAKNLALPDGSKEEPNSYVKVYLHPDPQKVTKRKTKVVRRNCHPSFMEMLEYRMPLERVRCRTLQATLWDCERFQEKCFLGAVTLELETLDLSKETSQWFKLTNFNRMPR